MGELRIFIPTRNSARWIGGFLDAYRQIGVEPLYIVDARSDDRTLSILRGKGADAIEFLPFGDFAEAGMIEIGAKSAGAPWVLRLDDDEFPSRDLLNWLKNTANFVDRPAWSISRRELSWRDDELVYSRWPSRFDMTDGFHFNGMARLWEATKVSYIEQVHSCGIEAPSNTGRAPDEVYFAHFNNVLRSVPERLEKIRRYAELDKNLAWRLADESLPELTDVELHAFTSEGTEEFLPLARRFTCRVSVDKGSLNPDEQRMLAAESQRWLAEAIRAAQWTIMQLREDRRALNATPLMGAAIRIIAKLTCTIGRLTNSYALQERGTALWNISKRE